MGIECHRKTKTRICNFKTSGKTPFVQWKATSRREQKSSTIRRYQPIDGRTKSENKNNYKYNGLKPTI